MRLDQYLVNNNYFKTRSRAQQEIKANHVLVNGKYAKASLDVSEDDKIELKDVIPYVSRGGLKLEKAIKVFNLDFNDKVVLDIGASTGGFSDCAIQHGAKLVYAVDVGSDQLDESLRNNPKIVSMENTNVLDTDIKTKIDFLVMDVSFVSIYHLIPAIKKYLNDNNKLVCLIKPQFEAGAIINKGIIKDKNLHKQILEKVKSYLEDNDLYITQIDSSPIKGGSGNIEFISIIETNKKGDINISAVIEKAHKKED